MSMPSLAERPGAKRPRLSVTAGVSLRSLERTDQVESTSADCIEGNERSDVTEDQSSGQNGNLSQGGVEDVRMDDVEVVPVDDKAGDQARPLAVGQASSSVKKATEQEGSKLIIN